MLPKIKFNFDRTFLSIIIPNNCRLLPIVLTENIVQSSTILYNRFDYILVKFQVFHELTFTYWQPGQFGPIVGFPLMGQIVGPEMNNTLSGLEHFGGHINPN